MTRYRLRRDVERYPHFIAAAGLTGTLHEEHGAVYLKMDEPLAGAEEWDNCIQWIVADGDDSALDLEEDNAMNSYQQRINAERLARQAPDVRRAAKEIFEALADVERYLYWSLDPSEKDGGAYYNQNLIDHAHALVDLGHAWRAALTANPPTKEAEDDNAA